jgi:nucleoside-triphosphatase THEP1
VSITLTEDQQAAYYAFTAFISDPDQDILLISGYAGTGKTTLIKTLRDDLTALLAGEAALTGEKNWGVEFTATTNKAAEAFAQLTGEEVSTLHSFLGLTVSTNYKTKKTTLRASQAQSKKESAGEYKQKIIFVDEASMVDHELLKALMDLVEDCKIVFIGDPAQLPPVKSKGCPVYQQGWPEVRLEKVVRQAEGSPIIDFATCFRNTVNGHEWLQGFMPDGTIIQNCDRDTFDKLLNEEFTRTDWNPADSKVLSYTNDAVDTYNHRIRDAVHGSPHLQQRDWAVVNQAYIGKGWSFRTDQLVYITSMQPKTLYGVDGWNMTLEGHYNIFMAASRDAKKKLIAKLRREKKWESVREVEDEWIDLRASYACTINKSQGSTYDRIFIDLNDLQRCRNPNQLARLMYVAVSRARHQIICTGDLVAQERQVA